MKIRTVVNSSLLDSLHFDYYAGGIYEAETPYAEKWMILPYTVSSQTLDGSCKIEFRDRPSFSIHPGEATIIPRGTYYRGYSKQPGKKMVFHWSYTRFTIAHGIDIFTFYEAPYKVPPKIGNVIGEINLQLANLGQRQNKEEYCNIARCKELGFKLLETILHVSKPKPEFNLLMTGLYRFTPVLEYVKEHYSRKMTVEELAGRTCLSPSRFQHLFKEVIGLAPMNYVIDFRMRRAQELLVSSDFSVAEIAAAVGYDDQFYFSKLFKRFCGQNPLKYRKNNQSFG